MDYVGEHLLPGQIGRTFVALTFITSLITAVAYYFFEKSNDGRYKKLARGSFITHLVSVVGIVAVLFFLMLNHYFEYDYVWKHSSMELPMRYIFSAFWEGQEGSFILWLFWHAVLGTILMFTAKKWEPMAMLVLALVQGFLASMILGIFPFGLKIGSSPFVLMRNTAENIGLPWTQMPDYLEKLPAFMDGSGLNPLLQNNWMTIHPPTLFLGFASVLIPFALALAGLLKKDFKGWIKPALPWAYFSVGILGLGILMGGAWAYEALSFGGFWAWDPVENSSLVPWLTMAAAAHLIQIYHNRQTGLRAAFFLVIISFILILYSTFLTRSGVLGDSSVHAFVDLGLSGQLLIYLLFFTVASLGLYLYHYKKIPSNNSEEKFSSREFWMFIGSLTLLISAFQIIFSTSIPVINKLIGPDGLVSILDDKMAPPLEPIDHYNSFQVPFAIIITLLIAVGQFLNYRHTGSKNFWKNITRSLAGSLVLTAFLAQLFNFWTDPLNLLLLFAGSFAALSNLDYWLIVRKAKFQFAGSSVAHLGFALIMLGALISNARQEVISSSKEFLSEDIPRDENAIMDLHDTVDLGPYKAVYQGMREERNKQIYDIGFWQPEGDSLQKLFEVEPYLLMADNMGPTPNPDTRHYLLKDVYSHITYSSALEPKSPDGYTNEATKELQRGDTAVYNQHFIILDSLKVNAGMNDERQIERIRLTAVLRIVNVMGQEFKARPVYMLEGNMQSSEDVVMEEQGMKFQFADVNTETNEMKIKAWTKQDEDEKPFIVMKTIVFPFINLLWAGCILMTIGTFIAVWQRVRRR